MKRIRTDGEYSIADGNASAARRLKLSASSAEWDAIAALYGDTPSILEIFEALRIQFYDNRSSPYSTGSIAGSGGEHVHEFEVGANIQRGDVQYIKVSKTAGTAASITLQFYDADPSGAGAIIYQVTTHDYEISAFEDRNNWFMELQAADSLWLRILNQGSTAATFDVSIRVRGD